MTRSTFSGWQLTVVRYPQRWPLVALWTNVTVLIDPRNSLRRCRDASWLPESGTVNSWQGEQAWLRHREKLEWKPRKMWFSTHGALGNRRICAFELSSGVLLAGEVAYPAVSVRGTSLLDKSWHLALMAKAELQSKMFGRL